MQRNFGLGLAVLASAVLGACGSAQVTVTVELQNESGETTVLEDVEVRLLPYDRDQIFDSLEAVADSPEPQYPPDLVAALDEVEEARQQWMDTENRWNMLRDTLNQLSEAMEGLNRGENRYREIFREWSGLESELQRAERRKDSDFGRFDELQQTSIGRSDSMKIVQADWAEEAFRDVGTVIAAKIEATGLDQAADTTGVAGQATFAVPPGEYWIFARHRLPRDELYWNVRIEVVRGEPVELRLTRENAEVRRVF